MGVGGVCKAMYKLRSPTAGQGGGSGSLRQPPQRSFLPLPPRQTHSLTPPSPARRSHGLITQGSEDHDGRVLIRRAGGGQLLGRQRCDLGQTRAAPAP